MDPRTHHRVAKSASIATSSGLKRLKTQSKVSRFESNTNAEMDAAQQIKPNSISPTTAQFVMPWFIWAAWISKFDGENATF